MRSIARRMLMGPVTAGAIGVMGAHCDSTGPSASIAWSANLQAVGGAGWSGRPAVHEGVVVVEDGPALLAVDASTGAIRWRTPLRQGVNINSEGIAIADGRVFPAGGDSVYAVSLASGARLWAFLPDAQAAFCQLSADGEAVYVGTRSRRVYALSADSGNELWSLDVGPAWEHFGIIAGTAVVGDTVFCDGRSILERIWRTACRPRVCAESLQWCRSLAL